MAGFFSALGAAASANPLGAIGLGSGIAGGLAQGIGSFFSKPSGTTPGMYSSMKQTLPQRARTPLTPQQRDIWEMLTADYLNRMAEYSQGTSPLQQWAGSKFGFDFQPRDGAALATGLADYHRYMAGM